MMRKMLTMDEFLIENQHEIQSLANHNNVNGKIAIANNECSFLNF